MIGTFKCAAIAAAVLATSAAFAATKTAPPRVEGLRDVSAYGTARPTARDTPEDTGSCVKMDNFGTNIPGDRIFCGIAGDNGTYNYRGIRYANAARWKPPSGTLPEIESYKALSYGLPCPQLSPDGEIIGNEDCLFLNIWTPRNAIVAGHKLSLPVLVYIHGGAFVTGSGGMNEDLAQIYDGSKLSARGAVVVTLNYRLGALGFLAANTRDTASAGNFGLQDQQAALSWINLFIANFGGDRHNITIFGESAGAMSVGLHLFDMREGTKPQFQKAIMESNPLGQYYLPATRARLVGNQFVDYLCTHAEKMKTDCTGNWASEVKFDKIVEAQDGFLAADHTAKQTNGEFDALNHLTGLRSLTWQPNVDGKLVLGEPYDGYGSWSFLGSNTRLPGKPFIVGMNQDEGVAFAAVAARDMNPGNPSAAPDPGQYLLLLANSFGSGNGIANNPRYNHNAAGTHTYSYYSADGQALANVIGDYTFVCGADKAATAALSQYPDEPVFAYYFAQRPFFDLFDPRNRGPADGACKPASGNVCHTNEIPYVFETLENVEANSGNTYKPEPDNGDDAALARRMADNWFQFASNTTPADWDRYAVAAHNAKQFIQPGAPNTVSLNDKSLCSTMWANRYGPPPAK